MFRNLHLKIFALGLSIAFWIFVVSIKNVFATLPHEIPIIPLNVGDDMAIATELPSVKVTVQAENPDFFRSLESSDFEATVDVRQLGVGEHQVGVSVVAKTANIRIVRSQPEEILVKLEPIREEIVPLSLELKGEPEENFEVLETKISHEFLRVKGAESVLREVDGLKAVVILDGSEDRSLQRKAEIQVKDRSGEVMQNVEVSQEEVFVDFVLGQRKMQKQVPVKVVLEGELPSGSLKKVTSNPLVVSIEGKKEVVEKLTVLETEPINVSALTTNITQEKTLEIPEGVSLIDLSSGKVTVSIEVSQE